MPEAENPELSPEQKTLVVLIDEAIAEMVNYPIHTDWPVSWILPE